MTQPGRSAGGTAPRTASTRTASTRKATPRKATPRKATPRKAAPRKATPTKATAAGAEPRTAATPTTAPRKATAAKKSTPRKSTPAESTQRTVAAAGPPSQARTARVPAAAAGTAATRAEGTVGVVELGRMELPLTHIQVPVMRLHAPSAHRVRGQVRWAAQAVRANLPSTDRLLYYGGLGALVAFGVLEWPVAAAVGAGVWLSARVRQRSAQPRMTA
ncbi:MAG TPA: hypothetical protein VF163_08055 [Micromonosporaceae bacterium]